MKCINKKNQVRKRFVVSEMNTGVPNESVLKDDILTIGTYINRFFLGVKACLIFFIF
jgi:hypothetical protein